MIKLNLGSCDNLIPGFVNVDAFDYHRAGHVFQQVDLNHRWPWLDSSVDYIKAHDIFEHIWPPDWQLPSMPGAKIAPHHDACEADDPSVIRPIPMIQQSRRIWVMCQAHRILKPGGLLSIIVPTTDGRGADQDPTHVTYWNPNSFFYYLSTLPEWVRFRHGSMNTSDFELMRPISGHFDNPETLQLQPCTSIAEAKEVLKAGHTTHLDEVTKLHVYLRAVKP